MANGTAHNWRTIAIWGVGVVIVLVVGIWLSGVFDASTEQQAVDDPPPETTTIEPGIPDPDAEEPQQQ